MTTAEAPPTIIVIQENKLLQKENAEFRAALEEIYPFLETQYYCSVSAKVAAAIVKAGKAIGQNVAQPKINGFFFDREIM